MLCKFTYLWHPVLLIVSIYLIDFGFLKFTKDFVFGTIHISVAILLFRIKSRIRGESWEIHVIKFVYFWKLLNPNTHLLCWIWFSLTSYHFWPMNRLWILSHYHYLKIRWRCPKSQRHSSYLSQPLINIWIGNRYVYCHQLRKIKEKKLSDFMNPYLLSTFSQLFWTRLYRATHLYLTTYVIFYLRHDAINWLTPKIKILNCVHFIILVISVIKGELLKLGYFT